MVRPNAGDANATAMSRVNADLVGFIWFFIRLFLHPHGAHHAGFHVKQQMAVVGPTAQRISSHSITASATGGISTVCLRTMKLP